MLRAEDIEARPRFKLYSRSVRATLAVPIANAELLCVPYADSLRVRVYVIEIKDPLRKKKTSSNFGTKVNTNGIYGINKIMQRTGLRFEGAVHNHSNFMHRESAALPKIASPRSPHWCVLIPRSASKSLVYDRLINSRYMWTRPNRYHTYCTAPHRATAANDECERTGNRALFPL